MEFGLFRMLSMRLPFAIYYHLSNGHVEVVAVLDCRRDPVSIIERLEISNKACGIPPLVSFLARG